MERNDKTIETLRAYFRISNAAFDFTNAVQLAVTGTVKTTPIHLLHKDALEEILKENPDLSKIDGLLAEMQKMAEGHGKPKTDFPKGGIIYTEENPNP